MPDVTVVIPFYNGGNTIKETVSSIIAQGLPSTQIIVVDDCSQTGPASFLAGVEAPITFIKTASNRGAAAARNLGLVNATGRYICFLDQDDLYRPGFFKAAIKILELHKTIAGVTTGIELIDCHRPVSDQHLRSMANCLPANMMLRTATARLIGGFPEDEEFRGVAAMEDYTFKAALFENFHLHHLPFPFLAYRVRRNSAFDFFMDRSVVVNGKLQFSHKSEEEQNGSLGKATQRYDNQVRERLDAVRGLTKTMISEGAINQFFQSNRTFEAMRTSIAAAGGRLDPEEGFTLFQWSSMARGTGLVLQAGGHNCGATAWLAAGSREARRDKVVIVDHPNQPTTPNHDAFFQGLRQQNLADWVICHEGDPTMVARSWADRIRFLLIAGELAYLPCRLSTDIWLRYVEDCGSFALLGVGLWPGITKLYEDVLHNNDAVRETCNVKSLRIFARR